MAMNTQKGNMYGFVTHTWNPIRGKCSHDCTYCYMKVWKQESLHLVEKELKTNLGQGNFIFVGSSTDMFADGVPKEWIRKVLAQCRNYEGNTYLLQTKNPHRYWGFSGSTPEIQYSAPHSKQIETRISFQKHNRQKPERPT